MTDAFNPATRIILLGLSLIGLAIGSVYLGYYSAQVFGKELGPPKTRRFTTSTLQRLEYRTIWLQHATTLFYAIILVIGFILSVSALLENHQ